MINKTLLSRRWLNGFMRMLAGRGNLARLDRRHSDSLCMVARGPGNRDLPRASFDTLAEAKWWYALHQQALRQRCFRRVEHSTRFSGFELAETSEEEWPMLRWCN